MNCSLFSTEETHDVANVTGRAKAVSAVYRPKTVEDVVSLVTAARRSRTPLYPISTGFNWGYGSRSPVIDQCALVDLSDMNRIRNAMKISTSNPVAVIEPGVTQVQLYELLETQCPNLMFNVTGASGETSILGNGLERGVGYQGPRAEDLFGLEIVTGTGEVIKTGFRRLGETSPLAHSHPFGLGPMIDGLFFQGNFGIVTSACFRLMPKPPCRRVVALSLRRPSDLSRFIDVLSNLKREGLLTSVAHVGNRERARSSLLWSVVRYLEGECGLERGRAMEEAERVASTVAPGEWTALASVSGTRLQVMAALFEIRRRTAKLARLMSHGESSLELAVAASHRMRGIPFVRRAAAMLTTLQSLSRPALGVPTDLPIENLLHQFGHASLVPAELDRSRCGLLFINPAMPSDGELAADVVCGMKKIAAGYGHSLYMTINIETTTSLVAVVNLLFDRGSEEETARAHACADSLFGYIRKRGLEVYRARADMMGEIVASDPEHWSRIRALKQVFDPENLIAPGRYNLA